MAGGKSRCALEFSVHTYVNAVTYNCTMSYEQSNFLNLYFLHPFKTSDDNRIKRNDDITDTQI